ncbi:tryptophan synthase subunit alpha [Xenorhabdus sp. BG5]|uniref:tryptophan synthase subunit alpha n=1 Tax=Xenorhabdus sp. BG5 TaxID=2782014 RepID=UPI001882518D|nr:tryptophan synthase subunit alpha [Xenorhabdus sp. BG5]MBE8594978.1 tryptophan synthase subunit alpha [Xenorhabdus sp. BG5]
MGRYEQLFKKLQNKNQGAFVPFVTLGDPNPALSLEIIDTLISGGADALELGIPFSDPLADGPTIQNANLRALSSKVTPTLCFDLLAKIRTKHPDIPIGLLIYANLVFHNGIDDFYRRCKDAGVDSVLVADVPLSESSPFRSAAIRHDIAPIFICPPNANDDLLREVASFGRGYTYLLSRAGVTGSENRAQQPFSHIVDKLKEYHAAPAIQGFGISEPKQVMNALNGGAAGAISGSAVVKIIEDNLHQPNTMLEKLTDFVHAMKNATQL